MARKILLYILLIFSLTACRRERATQWEWDGLVPIAHGRLELTDLVPDSLLEVGADGVIHFHFDENLANFNLDSLVQVPDTTIRKAFTIGLNGGPFNIPAGTTVLEQSTDNQFDIGGAQLRTVYLKGGALVYRILNQMNGNLVMNYSLPGVTKDGVSLELDGVLEPGNGSSPSIYEGSLALEGYHIDFTGENGDAVNTIQSLFSASVQTGGPAAQIYGTDSLIVEMNFVDPVVEYARGYFGEHQLNIDDTTNIEVLSSLAGGNLILGDVNLSLDIVNRVGADAQISIHSVKGYNSYNDALVEIENDDLHDQINLTRAFDNNGTVEPTYYAIALDQLNSNISGFLSNLPDELRLDIDLHVNPLGNVSANNDFIYTDSPLDARLVADIPLCIRMDNIRIVDTLAIENTTDWEVEGSLYLYAENTFPFGAKVEVRLIDESNMELATLAGGEEVLSGDYFSAGFEVAPNNSVMELQLETGVINYIQPGSKFVVTVLLNTYGNEEVKFTAENYLDLKVVADVKAQVTVE